MEIQPTGFKGLFLIAPKIYSDNRGYFFEKYNKKIFAEKDIMQDFLQENESFSYKNVLRGLHFQKKPFEQGKLISVVQGSIKDVVVDIRKDSQSYRKWKAFILDSKEKKSLFVPEEFAHGFLALEDSIVSYRTTADYNKELELGIIWNDSFLNINWGISNPILSEKDKKLPIFKDISNIF